jgi:Skp family chaperone for outer membrane proteins
MNRLTFGALAAASAMILPFAVQAQQLPAAAVGVVDTDQIIRTCTQCAAANTQLQAQATQLQQRAEALGAPLRTEEQALTQAVSALPQGTNPDQALTTRIQTFQTNQQNAAREIEGRQQQLQRNIAFVRQQIADRIRPAIQQVAQQRGATVVLDRGSLLANPAPAIDLTAAVLAVVNQNNTPFNINAPAPQQPAQQPAQQQQQPQQQRRPQGR